MPFPSPPWQMHAQMWLSLFRVRDTGRADRPDGLYGAAFVSYGAGSPLTYLELLVARLLDARARQVRITDIWVDSPASLAGGRSLWAIPKDLAELELDDRRLGPTSHTEFGGRVDGREIASGAFAALPGAALLRAPFRATTSQLRPGPAGAAGAPDAPGAEVVTPMAGSAKTLPALGSWEFAADGPLGFLHGRAPLASFRLTDVRLRFG
ncbi:MAG: acetoacetate decarboxylase family protein [Nocardioides sp.]